MSLECGQLWACRPRRRQSCSAGHAAALWPAPSHTSGLPCRPAWDLQLPRQLRLRHRGAGFPNFGQPVLQLGRRFIGKGGGAHLLCTEAVWHGASPPLRGQPRGSPRTGRNWLNSQGRGQCQGYSCCSFSPLGQRWLKSKSFASLSAWLLTGLNVSHCVLCTN